MGAAWAIGAFVDVDAIPVIVFLKTTTTGWIARVTITITITITITVAVAVAVAITVAIAVAITIAITITIAIAIAIAAVASALIKAGGIREADLSTLLAR